MALSNQLDKLTVRAKQAQTRAAARAGRRRPRRDLHLADERARQTWNDYIAAVHQTIDEANSEIDLAQAQHDADTAENDASYAIDYAYAAIEQAEYAVLRADFARIKADDLHAPA